MTVSIKGCAIAMAKAFRVSGAAKTSFLKKCEGG